MLLRSVPRSPWPSLFCGLVLEPVHLLLILYNFILGDHLRMWFEFYANLNINISLLQPRNYHRNGYFLRLSGRITMLKFQANATLDWNGLIYRWTFKHEPHKMDKHIQAIRQLLPTNCLSAFDYFVRLGLKEITIRETKRNKFRTIFLTNDFK